MANPDEIVSALNALYERKIQPDIERLRGEMVQMGEGLRGEMAQLGEGLRGEMAQLNQGLRSEIAQVDQGLRSEMAQVDQGLRGEIAKSERRLHAEIQEFRGEVDEFRRDVLGISTRCTSAWIDWRRSTT